MILIPLRVTRGLFWCCIFGLGTSLKVSKVMAISLGFIWMYLRGTVPNSSIAQEIKQAGSAAIVSSVQLLAVATDF